MTKNIDYHGIVREFHILDSRIEPFSRFCRKCGIEEEWEAYDVFNFWQEAYDLGNDDIFMESDGSEIHTWGSLERDYKLDEEGRFHDEYEAWLEEMEKDD